MRRTVFQKVSFGSPLRRGAGKFAPVADITHTILTITNDGGGACKITTVGLHGLGGVGGADLVISGNSVTAYNTTHTIVDASDPSFVVTNQSYTSNGAGGHWVLV